MGSACRNRLRKLFHDWRRRFGNRRNRRWLRWRRLRFDRRNLPGEWQWPGGSRSHSLGAKRNGPEPQDEKSGQYQDTGNRPFPDLLQQLLHAALITFGGIFRHRPCNDVIEPLRQLSIEKGRRHRFLVDYLERDRKGAVALKRPVTRQDRV